MPGDAIPAIGADLAAAIARLCAQGDSHADGGDFPAALDHYWRAWDLLPEPRMGFEEATPILAAIGDINFLGGDFLAGRDNLSTVMHCPGAIGIAFLHFRLGQCQFELGDPAAAGELWRAFHGGGAELFEDEDPKYLDCVRQADAARARPPWRFWK